MELQPCPECPPSRKQFIGPDLREYGIFNYNNSTFVSHELLDEYTSSFTLSETPFDAWVEFIQRRSLVYGSGHFMGKDLFRSCWFAYACLQKFEGDFECPECGKYPDNVIWDGVTLAFHRRQLLSSIHPPTSTSHSSEVRPTKYMPGQQALPFPNLRKSLRAISTADEPRAKQASSGQPRASEALASGLPTADIVVQLHEISPFLATVFQKHFGSSLRTINRAVRRFFFQLAAEESIIQMINSPAQEALRKFLVNPSLGTEQNFRRIPHVYDLVQFDQKGSDKQRYSAPVLGAVEWLLRRSATVLQQLTENSPPSENWNKHEASGVQGFNWEDVSRNLYQDHHRLISGFSQGAFTACLKFATDLCIPFWLATP